MEVAGVKGKGCDSARPWHAPLRFAQGRGADEASAPTLALIDSQQLGHFFVEESFTWAVGLEPMTVDH